MLVLLVTNIMSAYLFTSLFVKELFAELDKEEDGIVYTKNLIVQLRALNEDLDKNLKVCCILCIENAQWSPGHTTRTSR